MHVDPRHATDAPTLRRVGAFEVERPLGAGGMGVVVRARHVVSGAAVAIKLIAPGRADLARSARRFRDEVRAAARLDHPHVVRIHDFGEHRRGDEAPTPYIVMELCSGGTLDVAGCSGFAPMRAALQGVLAALAHAHARGVVHRDLKPSNVLVSAPGDERPGIKLIDFGLAHMRERLAAGLEIAGTPRYMAPEQFAGRGRDTGPATDLYALGCIAYELATGRAPFHGRSFAELAAAQTSAPTPPLRPRFAIPSGLDAWIERLLNKRPSARFACAADAAHALRLLGDECAVEPLPISRRLVDDDATLSRTVSRATALAPTSGATAPPQTAASAAAATATRVTTTPRPDATTTPRTDATTTPGEDATRGDVPPPMPPFEVALPPEVTAAIRADEGTEDPLGLGLGVYALRGLPFVARVPERARLWSALERTRATGCSRGVVVRGSSGIGKSRLVEWLAERSAELGAARTLRATHSRSREPDDGVGAMLARDLQLTDVDRDEVVARLTTLAGHDLAPHEIAAVAELISPTTDAHGTQAAHRHEAVRRLLAVLARGRPVVLWLDDVDFDLDAVDLARHILTRGDEAQAILVVAIAQPGEARPEARDAMDRLTALADVEVIDLEPLPADDHARFVRRLLRLSPAAASQIATRTAGSPSFAIALLGAWAEAGILEHDAEGFRIREGADTVVPPSLAEAWSERLERLLAHESHAARIALELAATCGRVVHADAWIPACARAGGDPRILERLVDARLARTHDSGARADAEGDVADALAVSFTFEHGLLVEAIRASAVRAERWASHGRVVASVVGSGASERGAGADRAERRGRLLLQARDAAAVDDLARAASDAQRRGELARALELADLARDALRVARAEPSDERWGEVAATRAAALIRAGTIGVAASLCSELVEDARRHGWSRVLPEALWAEGTVLGHRGDHGACRTRLEEALAGFRAIGHDDGAARVLRALVHVERVTDRVDVAEALLADWLVVADRMGDATSSGWAYQAKATLAAARGHLDEAKACVGRALSEMEAGANAFGTAQCLNTAAEIARRRGEHDAASHHYERALTLSTSLGLQLRHVVRLNLALLWIEQGRHGEAEAQLHRSVRAAPTGGMGVLDSGARAGLLCCAAAKRDGVAWRDQIQALRALKVGDVERETVAWIRRAGRTARQAGDAAHADEADELAARLTAEAPC